MVGESPPTPCVCVCGSARVLRRSIIVLSWLIRPHRYGWGLCAWLLLASFCHSLKRPWPPERTQSPGPDSYAYTYVSGSARSAAQLSACTHTMNFWRVRPVTAKYAAFARRRSHFLPCALARARCRLLAAFVGRTLNNPPNPTGLLPPL